MNERPPPWENYPPRTTIDEQHRLSRFNDLFEMTRNHPRAHYTVQHFAALYARGNVVTYIEALQQIIVHLAREMSSVEDLHNWHRWKPAPTTVTPEMLEEVIKQKLEVSPHTATGEMIAKNNEIANEEKK